MSKYLKVELARTQMTEVYLEVPDDFDLNQVYESVDLEAAAAATTSEKDWQPYPDMVLEALNCQEVPKEEAETFETWDVKNSCKSIY